MAADLASPVTALGLLDGRFPAGCPSRTLMSHVTSKWGVLVLVALGTGTLRWSELLRMIEGISEKMLAQTLRTFEDDGLVLRHVEQVVPPRVSYRLSPAGREATTRLMPLLDWLTEYAGEYAARVADPSR